MDELEIKDIRKSKKPVYTSAAVLLALIIGYMIVPSMRFWLDEAWAVLTSGDEQRIHTWVEEFGWFGPILLVLAMIVQMFLIIIPSWLLMLVAMTAYGPVWGSLIVFAAIFAASTVGYIIGRYLGPEVIMRLIGPKSERKVAQFLESYGIWAIIITRLNPLLSNDAISFIAGVVKMSYRKFILATLIGIAPLVILIAALGQLGEGMQSTLIWISIVSLVLFVAFVWWNRKKRHRK